MIVDDDQEILNLFNVGLQRHGFNVEAYSDPLLALSHFKEGSFDIAMLDVRMPLMDGFELSQKLLERDPNLIIGFVTAYEIQDSPYAKEMPQMSADHFLRKPVSIADLSESINKLLVR